MAANLVGDSSDSARPRCVSSYQGNLTANYQVPKSNGIYLKYLETIWYNLQLQPVNYNLILSIILMAQGLNACQAPSRFLNYEAKFNLLFVLLLLHKSIDY